MVSLAEAYSERRETVLVPIVQELEVFLTEQLRGIPGVDQVRVRAKSTERFLAKGEKREKGKRRYSDPLNQIQDQIGARIVALYLDDVEFVAKHILNYFSEIEDATKSPPFDYAFGYFGRHFIFLIPDQVIPERIDPQLAPKFFELQIHTVFQHAWAEASHDLDYKPQAALTQNQMRSVAFASAQAWGADHIFNDLQRELGIAVHRPGVVVVESE